MKILEQEPYHNNFKYFNELLGYWIEEDNGNKSFVMDVNGPYFKSFIRLKYGQIRHNKTFHYIIRIHKNGYWSLAIVWENCKGLLRPKSTINETPTERLLRFYSYKDFPKLRNELTEIVQREFAYKYGLSLMIHENFKIYE